MREGLRSGKALAKSVPEKLEINDVVLNGVEGLCLVSSRLGYKEELLSRGTEKTQIQHVKKDCTSHEEMASGNCVHSFVNKKGRKSSSRGNACRQNENKEKHGDLSGEGQFSGRVLRSKTKCNLPRGEEEAKSIPEESEDILVTKRKMKAEKEDDDFVDVIVDKNKTIVKIESIDSLGTGHGLTNKSQRKRWKSAAFNTEEHKQFLKKVNQQSSGKCQLSSNLKGSNGLVKVVSREKVIQNRRKCSNMEVNMKNNATPENKQTQEVYRCSPKHSKVKSSSPAKKAPTRKQLLREKIAEILFAAGWKVDYRPRNNKDYFDAVYVSLDRRTHWSITLAYRRLKQHYEAGDGEDKVYKPGFKFTPIPDEEFNLLTKVMVKKRTGKKKNKQKGKKVGGNKKFVYKVKPGSDPCLGRPGKGKTKRKITDQDHSIMRDRKRQKSQNSKRCTILVRNAEKKVDSEKDGYTPYAGKRTLLTWMIDSGSVPLNCSILYINPRKQRVLRQGRITRDGIHCDCCDEIVSISEFEAHARSELFEPLKNIYLERGTPLLNCLLESWNKQDESERKGFHFININSEDPNDDTCGICGDGGDLVCCDSCPSTFHQSCLDIKNFPSGDWNCFYCCCKFCGLVGGSTHERKDDGDIAMSALITCHLCEEKYHKDCSRAKDAKMEILHESGFCEDKCQQLFKGLEMLLGVKHVMEDGFSWTLYRRSDVFFNGSEIKTEVIESNSKLAIALLIMDECFLPIIDHRSGINMIHSVIYNRGSNINRLNYSGFFTAILERGDEIMSAASLRIRGNQLAEMPFIGTRYLYRRQGMCRRLLYGIESALRVLNVELLVIPAVSELRKTWTTVFGFVPLDVTNLSKIKNKNLMVFPSVDMLQKKIMNLSNGESVDCQLRDCHSFAGMTNNFDQSNSLNQGCSSALDPKVREVPELIERGISDLEAISAHVSINDTLDHENKNICQIKPDSFQSDLKDDINGAHVKDTPIFVHQISNSCCEPQSKDEKETGIASQCNKYCKSVKELKIHCEKRDDIVENNVNGCLDSTKHIGPNIAVKIANHAEEFEDPVDNIWCDLACNNQPSSDATHVVDPDSLDVQSIGCASDLHIPSNQECTDNQLHVEHLCLESTQECGEPAKCCSSQLSPSVVSLLK